MSQQPKQIQPAPYSEKPVSTFPNSKKELISKSTRQARQDIRAILNDAEENRRPWPTVPENVKKMNLVNLLERIKVLNDEEERLLWEIEIAETGKDGKKVVELRGKKLDVVRLRSAYGEHVQMRAEENRQDDEMIVREKSPAPEKEKLGYVYLGRYKDEELWIKEDNQAQAVA
jgi:hypothetical protein